MGLKKRYTSYLLTLSLLFIVATAFGSTDKYRCMWQEDPSTTMVIAWNQISGNNPVLYFDEFDGGNDPSLYSNSQKPDRMTNFKGMNNQFVRLRGLRPGTVYHFVIQDSDSVSKRMSFRTAPDHPYERISIIAGGDSRNFRSARRRANMLVAKLQAHCVLFGGDMTGGDTAKEWREWFDDWQHTITKDGRLTPIITTRGNHEYSNQTIVDLFDVPNDHVYYTLEIGGELLQIYTLNSLIATGGEQKKWLERELQNSRHTWKTAQYHFGIRPHTQRKTERNPQLLNWAPLFYKHQVNLVVESDAHVVKTTWPIRPSRERGSEEGFIRDDRRGTVYVGEGCWGAPLRRNNDDKSWTRNSGSFNQFKWIFVDQEKIEVRTVKTDNAESVASVSPYDIFSAPDGLDLWDPSNGKVLTIYRSDQNEDLPVAMAYPVSNDAQNWTASKNQVIGNLSPSKAIQREKKIRPAILIQDFVTELVEGTTSIRWTSQNEYNPSLVYELQRSEDGRDFHTIAEVRAQGSGGGKYAITDAGQEALETEELKYRLRFNLRGQAYQYDAASKVVVKKNPWRALPELIPDPENGQLKVKYHLQEASAVKIQLLDIGEKVVSMSDYPDQKSGNYLKTINLAIFPKGLYLMVIKVNEENVSQYQVIWR